MPKSKKPRKAYKPKRVDSMSSLTAIYRKQWTPDAIIDVLMTPIYVAFDALKKGQGDCCKHLNALAQLVNISMVLCEQKIGDEYLQIVLNARDCIAKAMFRGDKTGRWALDGAAFEPIGTLLEVHKAQLENAKRGEVANAMREVLKRNDARHVLEMADIA
jgi:hypothetical protein